MALRLVRKSSDTPNITNKDDVRMARYAYGGYNGIVKGFGNECEYTAENGIFKLLDGIIVVDGWEIFVEGGGVSLDFSNIIGAQYHSVYLQINVATTIEDVSLKSVYSQISYSQVEKGDDLTSVPNGTAKFLLYNVKVVNGAIVEVVKKFETIPYLSLLENGLKNGNFIPKNSQQVNGLEIMRDENGVLKIGDIIIPQKRLLWALSEGKKVQQKGKGFAVDTVFTSKESLENKTLQIEYKQIQGSDNGARHIVTIKLQNNKYAYYQLNFNNGLTVTTYFQLTGGTNLKVGISHAFSSSEVNDNQTSSCTVYSVYEIIE